MGTIISWQESPQGKAVLILYIPTALCCDSVRSSIVLLLCDKSRVKRAGQEGDFHQKPYGGVARAPSPVQAEVEEGSWVPSPSRDRLAHNPNV